MTNSRYVSVKNHKGIRKDNSSGKFKLGEESMEKPILRLSIRFQKQLNGEILFLILQTRLS